MTAQVHLITGVPFTAMLNNGTNTLSVAGDFVRWFQPNVILGITDGANGGYQRVTSAVFTSGSTVVTVTPYSLNTSHPGPSTFTSETRIILNFGIPKTNTSWKKVFSAVPTNTFTYAAVASANQAIVLGNTALESYITNDAGTTWAVATLPADFYYLYWTGTNYIGITVYPFHFYTSTNGTSWTLTNPPAHTDDLGVDISYVAETGDLFFVYNYQANNLHVDLYRLPKNSSTWTQVISNAPGPLGQSGFGLWGSFGTTIIAGNQTGGAETLVQTLFRSTNNGVTWTSVASLTTGYLYFYIKHNGSKFLLLGSQQVSPFDNQYYTSSDGSTWVASSTFAANATLGIPFISKIGLHGTTFFTCSGIDISYSTNGTTWTVISIAENTTLSDFITVGSTIYVYSHNEFKAYKSIDGIIWLLDFKFDNSDLFITNINQDSTNSLVLAVGAFNPGVGNSTVYKKL